MATNVLIPTDVRAAAFDIGYVDMLYERMRPGVTGGAPSEVDVTRDMIQSSQVAIEAVGGLALPQGLVPVDKDEFAQQGAKLLAFLEQNNMHGIRVILNSKNMVDGSLVWKNINAFLEGK